MTDDEREAFWQNVLDTITAERALADDLAAALTTALDLLDTDDDNGTLNEIRGPLARYRETRGR